MGALALEKRESNSSLDSSLYQKSSDDGIRIYKLLIQIEKIRPKPCPRSKKPYFLADVIKRGEERIANLSPALVCTEEKSASSRKPVSCSACKQIFQSAQSLYLHKKKQHRFICNICDVYCSTRIICERHEKLHVSVDPTLPYKCHLCLQNFDTKRNVRLHIRVVHSYVEPNLGKAPGNPSREIAARFKLTQHIKLAAPLTEKIIDVDLRDKNTAWRRNDMNKMANNHRALSFSCRVCSKDFPTVEAAEAHKRNHMELVEEDHKCNICKKIFQTEMSLNAHLAEHLSRALRCPMCPKAFINRATLRIHMKSHSLDK